MYVLCLARKHVTHIESKNFIPEEKLFLRF